MGEWDGTERQKMPHDCHEDILRTLAEMRATQEVNAKLLKQTVEFITGNGHPERGAIVRLDRLEQTEHRRLRTELAAWAALIGIAIKTAWDVLVRGPR